MRRTILLADDSPTIRKLVTQIFADADFDIISVSNGEAAIKAFEEKQPSVVLADIYMPGKNGYEVCKYVRSHPKMGKTPVVLLVGAFDAFDEETARSSGATANITKPFEPGSLIELVVSVLPAAGVEAIPEPEVQAVPQEKADESDLLGLGKIFREEPSPAAASRSSMSEEDLERIADRVIQKLSTQIIENIAWDVVPDITEKIVREELKKNER